MPSATERILARLKEVGFETRLGGATPFGEQLPLVTGVAWEKRTAQLALVADSQGAVDRELWRQLLFAGSGIRHQLSGEGPSAFGTPVILAIVDAEGKQEMRSLVEDLSKNYAVFNRVDINLVLESQLGDRELLDDVLAPLLPRCRSLRGQEISRQEVQKFWTELRREVEKAAGELDDAFASMRAAAGREGADALIGDSEQGEELPSPTPLGLIELTNFRSIKHLEVSLCDVNIVHGPNGGGKTSVVEAMELGWAGTSQRKPWDVKPAEYAKHLPRNGEGDFSIKVDERKVEGVSDRAEVELSRCVLTHEAMTTLVSEEPRERFKGLLAVTGLEIPDLDGRTKALVASAKSKADEALAQVGIGPLARADSKGLEHLQNALRSNFLRELAGLPELGIPAKTLSSVSGGAYEPREWPEEAKLTAELESADSEVAEAAEGHGGDSEVARLLDQAAVTVDALLASRLEAASNSRRLLEALQQHRDQDPGRPREEDGTEDDAEPIGVELAARWLNHAQASSQAADRFRKDAGEIDDDEWAERLIDYAEAVERASALAPDVELERLSKPRRRQQPKQAPEIGPEVYKAAGFAEAPGDPEAIVGALREMANTLQMHVEGLRVLAERLRGHPTRRFGAHRELVMNAMCRFELAKNLRRGGPILQTSERLVSELLDGRLAPVVRELVGAIVRFEWYFKPLQMTIDKKAIVFGGLATDRADLDARLLLNSAEQTVLGVAWFLGLHMLQPEERRRVLVLDDPTSGFDAANQAGFASTLRAFVRLLEPEQVVLTTHDDAVAAVLAEELAVVDGWPESVSQLRFHRDKDDCTVVSVKSSADADLEFEPETERLGLLEDAPASG